MTFALSRRPGVVIIADDSQTFADTLRLVVAMRWPARTVYGSAELEELFSKAEAAYLLDIERQNQILKRDATGNSLLPDILAYWRICADRYDIPIACLFDYFMPGKNGLAAMQSAGRWPGVKLMISGMAEDAVAVQAFNDGEIHGFLPKQAEGLGNTVVAALDRLMEMQNQSSLLSWPLAGATLSVTQSMALRGPKVEKVLKEWVNAYCVEYVVLGRPFGILGLSAEGEPRWLQLRLWSDAPEVAEPVERTAGSGAPVPAIAVDESVVPLMATPRSHVATEIAIHGELTAAAVRLDDRHGPGAAGSYAAFCKQSRKPSSRD